MEHPPVWSPRNYSIRVMCCRACSAFITDEYRGITVDDWNLYFCALDIHNVHFIENQLICYCGIPVGNLVPSIFGDYCYEITRYYLTTINEGNGVVRAMSAQITRYPEFGFYGCYQCHRPFVASETIPNLAIGGIQFNPFDCANLEMRRGLNRTAQRHLVCLCSNVVGEIFGILNAVLYTDRIVNFLPNGGHNPFGVWVSRQRGRFIFDSPVVERREWIERRVAARMADEWIDEDPIEGDSGYENSDTDDFLQ